VNARGRVRVMVVEVDKAGRESERYGDWHPEGRQFARRLYV
jgi:hypothetical protein